MSLDPPRIVETEAQPAAVIPLDIARSEMPQVFGPAVAELMAALQAQGVEPIGSVFAHHLRMASDRFTFELGVKVAGSVAATGRMRPGELPAVRVARTIYTGPYQGLPGAWDEFMGWIGAEGHRPAPNLWELYAIGPHSQPDPALWQTELTRPLL
jgi:effector-binding domain-containing protein